MLNHDINSAGALDKGVPYAANTPACEVDQVTGENYVCGKHYADLTNESYSWHYNSNSVHHIQRINGDGECEICYTGNCLVVNPDPKHSIEEWRAILDVDELCNKVPGGKLKRLVWVDGTDTPMGCLDVEASIATDFFTTPFFDLCGDPCAYLQMCVPEIDGCIAGEWIMPTASDTSKGNLMLDKGFKYAIRHVYYDGRASELSDRSVLYFQDSRGCFDNSDGYPRCMKFRLPVGNPMVEKIEFYVSEDGGLTWFLRETIEKYKKYNSSQQYWYQRELSEIVSSSFSEDDCSFDYVFCNDKQRIPADPKLITRVTNPIPREAQAVVRIKDMVAAVNYVSGTCPVDKNEIDKITLGVDCTTTEACETEFAKVTVRAVVYNHWQKLNGAVMRANGPAGVNVENEDDLTDPAVFFSPAYGTLFGGYGQVFSGKTRNFIVYIEGTDYWVQMEQWRSTPYFASVKKVGTLSGEAPGVEVGEGLTAIGSGYGSDVINGNYYYQEGILTVPKGTKGFLRLVSHNQTSGSGSNQNTSTQVTGIIGNLADYTGTTELELDGLQREIYFDTCDGDVDIMKAFIVDDLFEPGEDSVAYDGYITNDDGLPVEGAKIYKGDYNVTTDYNGYYVINNESNGLDPTNLSVRVEQGCSGGWTEIDQFSVVGVAGKKTQVDYSIQSSTASDDFFAQIDVAVNDCNGAPIKGVRVAMSGAKYKITNTQGIARFKLKNYETRSRDIVAVVMDKANCFSIDCNGDCNPCMPSTDSLTLMSCFISEPTYPLTLNTNLNVDNILANKKTLKRGGIYDMGIVVEGDCGQLSAVYPVTTFNIPRLQETGGYSICQFTYNTNGAIFPLWAKRGKIVRSANLNPFTLQWVVDDIERTSEGKMILTIQSLNDYNTRYNFNTNTVYKFLQGDRVEFIRNGDGKVFDAATYGILNYQVLSPFNDEVLSEVTDDVDYFNQIKITDDGKLEDLKKGAIIQISPLALSAPQVTYFEICASFEIENGLAVNPQGTFETFDTYLVSRQIDSFPPQYFEHRSPSDFWGETTTDGVSNFLSDIGKVHFLNPYENEKRYPRNFSINSSTQFNYFGDFVKKLDAENQGAITAVVIKDDKIGLAICENDTFLFQVSDDLLRLGNDGVVRAASADSIISNPEAKIVGQYGCQYQDIGSVFFGDGYAMFFDSKADNYIIHNFSYAKIAGSYVFEGQVYTACNSFFKKVNRQKENFNKTSADVLNNYRFSTGINVSNGVVFLTMKALRHAGINNEKDIYLAPNWTLAFNPANDSFLGFVSFTPEMYSQLELATSEGCAFLAYQNGIPFIHALVPTRWNEFFGVACDQVIGVVLNKFTSKIKIPISIEVQSDQMFFVSKVTTRKHTFVSKIPAIRWKQAGQKWNAAVLNDINSRGGLYNGATARDYAISFTFVKDNTINNEYGSINPNKQTQYNEVSEILFKFMLAEQSGLTENL